MKSSGLPYLTQRNKHVFALIDSSKSILNRLLYTLNLHILNWDFIINLKKFEKSVEKMILRVGIFLKTQKLVIGKISLTTFK